MLAAQAELENHGPDVVRALNEKLAAREAVLKRTNEALRLDIEGYKSSLQHRQTEISRIRIELPAARAEIEDRARLVGQLEQARLELRTFRSRPAEPNTKSDPVAPKAHRRIRELEKLVADPSTKDPRFLQFFPTSELTPTLLNPLASPTFVHGAITHG